MLRDVSLLMGNWEFSPGDTPKAPGSGKLVNLPHDWAITRPFDKTMDWGVDQAFRDWWGVGWYRKRLSLAKIDPTRRYYLDFDGIYENSTVYVNSSVVGGHAYGYSPFRLDVTEALVEGDNDILIRVENLDSPTDRWYSGAGIYRDVRFMDLPREHLDERDVVIRQSINDAAPSALLDISTGITADMNGWSVRANLFDAEGKVVASGSGRGTVSMEVSPCILWSAENPYLYSLELDLCDETGTSVDTISWRVGLRSVVFDAQRGMLVNGEKTIFRGVCLHQDAGCLGSASTEDVLRDRLTVLKGMGCNALRLAHHAHPREMLDLADEMGFYVYAEPFDKWQSGHYKRYFDDGWRTDLAAMMKRDRNRPSVVMWGVGNEVENQAKSSMLSVLKRLVDEARRLDASGRPVGCAMSPHFQTDHAAKFGNEGILQATDEIQPDEEINDPDERVRRIKLIADITDITVLNYSEQWYEKVHRAIADKPIFGSEVYQYFQGQEWQMQDYRVENPNLVPERLQYVVGGAIWSGFDYLGESMGWPSKGWSGALLRTTGVPRTGYWLMRSYWTTKPFVHFMVADYSQPDENVKEHWDIPPYVGHWHFPQYHRAVLPYMIATNCDTVRIWVNWREIVVDPVRSFPNRVVQGYLPYQPGKVTVRGYVDGTEVCRETVCTPVSPAVQLQFVDPIGNIALAEVQEIDACRRIDRLFNIRCLDTDGNAVFRESAPVSFSVEGPARIVAVDNGNLMNNEPYDAPTIHLHQGTAAVMIEFSGESGRVELHADAPGMGSASVTAVVR